MACTVDNVSPTALPGTHSAQQLPCLDPDIPADRWNAVIATVISDIKRKIEQTLKQEIHKLPQLDKQDVKAIRSFLPGKLLGRITVLLSLVLGVLFIVIKMTAAGAELGIPTWATWTLLGLCFLAVVVQVVRELLAERTRHSMQILAVKPGAQQSGYFRIGPYQNTPEDREKFERADNAEKKALEWINRSNQIPLYLCGDLATFGILLNAFVLPKMREQGWTLVEARAWQDPDRALRDGLQKLPFPRPRNVEGQSLRGTLEKAAKHAPG